MAFKLLGSNEFCSLEFDGGDHEQLWSSVDGLFGGHRWTRDFGEIEFGGETFTEADDWGTPCLIARSARGVELLGTLARELSPNI